MIRGQRGFYDVASILVTGIDDELRQSPAGRPDRACVVPGEIAWDGCDCGMLAVSVRSWVLTDSFPDASEIGGALRAGPCEMPYIVAAMEIQIVRCSPSPDGVMLNVPCPELDVAAQILIEDAWLTVRRTTVELCELKSDEQIVDYVVAEQNTIGPSGGCVGTSLLVSVALER